MFLHLYPKSVGRKIVGAQVFTGTPARARDRSAGRLSTGDTGMRSGSAAPAGEPNGAALKRISTETAAVWSPSYPANGGRAITVGRIP